MKQRYKITAIIEIEELPPDGDPHHTRPDVGATAHRCDCGGQCDGDHTEPPAWFTKAKTVPRSQFGRTKQNKQSSPDET